MQINIKNSHSVFFALLITVLILRPIDSFDIWWHLNSGLWMFENGQVLDFDIWSFTHADKDWFNVAWLFQIILALFYMLGDIWGLFLLKGLLIFTIFFLVSQSIETKEKYASLFISFLVLLPGIYGHLHLRPHLAELIALVSVVMITQGYLSKRKAIFSFFILLMWANIHASVVVGAFALAIQFLFGSYEQSAHRNLRFIAPVLFILTPLFTPYGIDIISVLFAHGGSDFIQYYVSEWLPHDLYPINIWISIILVTLFFTNKIIKISIAELLLLIFFLYYSLQNQRFELELCILLLRPLTESIAYGLNKLKSQSPKYPLLLSTLIILIHCVIYTGYIQSLSPVKNKNTPYDKYRYPSVTLSQLINLSEILERPVNIINDYNFGGYISLKTKGNVKVFVDSRMSTIFPESLLLPPYESDPVILKSISERYQADAILLKLENSSVLPVNDDMWQIAAYDTASILFVRRSLAESVDLPDIKYDPGKYSNQFLSDVISENINSTNLLLQLNHDNPVALNHMAIFLTRDTESFVNQKKIFDLLDKSIKLNPNDIFSRATYAYLAVTNQQKPLLELFFKHLPEAKLLNDGISLTYDLRYARTLIENGLSDLALDYLYPDNKERRYQLDKIIEAWKLRVIAHLSLNEDKKAKNCLEIAYEMLNLNNLKERHELDKLKKNLAL